METLKGHSEIEEPEENLKAIFENASEGFVLLDKDCVIKTFNNKAKHYIFSNIEKEVKAGCSIYEYVPMQGQGFIREKIDKVLNGEMVQYERSYETGNNNSAWYSFSMTPVREKNQVNGICITAQDITERKKEEEALKKSESYLKSANRDLETFIYRASHDLRGPLSSIIGLTNVCKLEVKDEKALEYIELIQQSTKKLDDTLIGLVQTMAIKDIVRFEDEISFRAIIDDVLEKFKFYDGFSKVKFNIQIDLNAPFISSKAIIEPILQNLIENSIKYRDINAEESYTNITISDSADDLKIVFEDNGLGMDPSIHEKIFDVYYKGTAKSKGSGLGLYIVKSGIAKLNGNIYLESEPGKGSTFTVVIPKKS